jgi:hypothetical protein
MRRRIPCLFVAAVLVGVTGCASGSGNAEDAGSGATTSASPTAASPTDAAAEQQRHSSVAISVAVAGGKVSPRTQRIDVPKDSRVRLQVTTDVDDEVHVHGYDLEEPLEAGRTATIEFVADQQGVFTVETHEGGLKLLQLEVR